MEREAGEKTQKERKTVMGILTDDFTVLKKSGEVLYKTPKSIQETIEILKVAENGQLHRKKLGNIVFADEKALADLNKITHTAVKAEVLQLLETAPKLAAIDAIALFEGNLAELCDVTVAVTAPTEDRVRRLMARDSISEEYARKRIEAQRSCQEFAAMCNYTLENNGDIGAFRTKCLAFLRNLDII